MNIVATYLGNSSGTPLRKTRSSLTSFRLSSPMQLVTALKLTIPRRVAALPLFLCDARPVGPRESSVSTKVDRSGYFECQTTTLVVCSHSHGGVAPVAVAQSRGDGVGSGAIGESPPVT